MELWSDGGSIGTVGDGTISDFIKNYVENQRNKSLLIGDIGNK
jgi:putative transposase